MTGGIDYTTAHLGEEILGECHHCRLPVYQSDPRRLLGLPPGSVPFFYHAGCAMSAEGAYWEGQVKKDIDRLRGCGYVVELKLIRPVH